MLTLNSTKLDFNFREIIRNANIILGKSKTDELLKDNSNKGFLLLLGNLEAEAKKIIKNKNYPVPADIPKNISVESAQYLRWQIAQDIQQWATLPSVGSTAIHYLYRIRGENQFRAVFENEVSISKGKQTNVQLRVGLFNLEKLVQEAETTGTASISIQLQPDQVSFIENTLGNNKINVVFQDELPQRPEVRRLQLGNIASLCEAQALSNGTSPSDEILNYTTPFLGQNIPLAKECVVENIQKTQNNNRTTLTLEVEFPEIKKKIIKAQEAFETDNGKTFSDFSQALNQFVKGALTDGDLRRHTGNSYGCNGRDFVAASTRITKALENNLEEATKDWFNIKVATAGDIQAFLDEYATISLTLRRRPKPKTKLEIGRSSIKSVEELVSSKPDAPEHNYGAEITKNAQKSLPKSCSASAGPEWLESIVENDLQENLENQTSINYAKNIESLFGIKAVGFKQQLVEANLFQKEVEGIKPLDKGPEKIIFSSPFLTQEKAEEYELLKDQEGDRNFSSKDGVLRNEDQEGISKDDDGNIIQNLQKDEWIRQNVGEIELEIPQVPSLAASLHRLTHYPNKRSGLSYNASRAKKYDPSISMPTASYWKIPAKADGYAITLKDCLTPEAYAEAMELSNEGNEAAIKDMVMIKIHLEEWQSSLRRISPISKNPFEARLWRWLESLSKNEEDAKCKSLKDLATLLGPSLTNCGKIPFDSEKRPEDFQVATTSSNLPLLALCGVDAQEFKTLHNDTTKLLDMHNRYQNAGRLSEEMAHTKKATLVEKLEEAIASIDENALLEHAIINELSSDPDFKGDYLKTIGLSEGISSLPKEMQSFGDILLPLSSSPNTTIIKGEETPIDSLLEVLKNDGVVIQLTEEEKTQVEEAPKTALSTFQNQCSAAIKKLGQTDNPNGEEASISIFLFENKKEEEVPSLTFFQDTIETLHKELPESDNTLQTIIEAILTNRPKTIKVNLTSEVFTAKLGSGNTWNHSEPKKATAASLLALEKIQEAENLISKENQEQEQGQIALLKEAKNLAYQARLMNNIERVPEAIDSLPTHLKSQHSIQEICQPLNLLAQQLLEAKKAEKVANFLLKNLNESEDLILNPHIYIQELCTKITGEVKNEEKKYFVQRLFTEKEKNEAAQFLGRDTPIEENLQAASLYLQTTLNNHMKAVREQASQNLPELLGALQNELNSVLEKSRSQEVTAFFTKNDSISTLLKDKTKYRILDTKITQTIKDLSRDKGRSTTGKTTTYEQIGRDIIPGNGTRENIQFRVDKDAIKINKVWGTWLKTKTGQENVAKRLNLAAWIKETKTNPKTCIAFLEFLRHRIFSSTPAAIASGKLTEKEKRTIATALGKFETSLKAIHINPKTASLSTQLHGALALSQYTENKYLRRNPWNIEWERELEDIKTNEVEIKNSLPVTFEKQIKGISLPSTFKKYQEDLLNENPEDDLKEASSQTLRQVASRGVAAIIGITNEMAI